MSAAQFMGGPADGQIHDFPGTEPPKTIEIPRMPPAEPVVYERQVSQLDDGPLWVYVPRTEEPTITDHFIATAQALGLTPSERRAGLDQIADAALRAETARIAQIAQAQKPLHNGPLHKAAASLTYRCCDHCTEDPAYHENHPPHSHTTKCTHTGRTCTSGGDTLNLPPSPYTPDGHNGHPAPPPITRTLPTTRIPTQKVGESSDWPRARARGAHVGLSKCADLGRRVAHLWSGLTGRDRRG